jgi:hypothetical protein
VTVAVSGVILLIAALWLGFRSTALARLDDPHDEATLRQ